MANGYASSIQMVEKGGVYVGNSIPKVRPRHSKHLPKASEDKPWLGKKEDRRRLSEIIQLWHNLHGQALVASKSRLAKLQIVCNGLGDPIASRLTAKDWAHYRDRRLRGEIDNGYHKDPRNGSPNL